MSRIDERMAGLSRDRHRAPRRPGLGEIALDLTAQDPDREVIRDGERRLTRGDMLDMALRLGGAFERMGLSPGAPIPPADVLNADLLEFTRKAINLRTRHPVFRRRRFFAGKPIRWGDQALDIVWLTPAGQEMTSEDWDSGFGRSLAVYFNGDGIDEPDERGEKIVDDSFIVFFNAHDGDIDFTLPPSSWGVQWVGELDTTDPTGDADMTATADSVLTIGARSVLVLRREA